MNGVFSFFRFAKLIYLLLFIITIFTGCEKNQNDIEQNNTKSLDLTKNGSTMSGTITEENFYNVDGGAYIDFIDIQYNTPTELSNYTSDSYFTEEFLENALKDHALSGENIIFDRLKAQGLKMYHGGPLFYDSYNRFFYYTNTHLRYFEYENYNIMLVTQKNDDIEYVRDYLILKKLNPETHLFYSEGTVTINGESPGFAVTVVVNHHWRGIYTEDISQAFYVNTQTGKIEQVFFDTIRLASEI
jgi:hypothetical protein